MRNKKGQSTVEAVLTMGLFLLIILGVMSIGLYIYNMSVYAYAANKAMDAAVSQLSRDEITLVDGISGNELDETARQRITDTALDALSFTVMTETITESNVTIATIEEYAGVYMTVILTGKYNFPLPLSGLIFPDFYYDLEYVYYY